MSDPRPSSNEEVSLQRSRHKRKKETPQQKNWLQRNGLDLLLVLSGVTAVLLLINPIAYSPTPDPKDAYLVRLFGLVLLTAVYKIGWSRVTHRINHNPKWSAAVCPQCQMDDLKRTHRHQRDRLLSKMGIPVRRYICRQCGWHGSRISHK